MHACILDHHICHLKSRRSDARSTTRRRRVFGRLPLCASTSTGTPGRTCTDACTANAHDGVHCKVRPPATKSINGSVSFIGSDRRLTQCTCAMDQDPTVDPAGSGPTMPGRRHHSLLPAQTIQELAHATSPSARLHVCPGKRQNRKNRISHTPVFVSARASYTPLLATAT